MSVLLKSASPPREEKVKGPMAVANKHLEKGERGLDPDDFVVARMLHGNNTCKVGIGGGTLTVRARGATAFLAKYWLKSAL